MNSGGEMDRVVEGRIERALRAGVTSTPEARERVMRAVRAATPPVRGVGDDADLGTNGAPSAAARRFWRSPAFGLLAAASLAGVIALVHALGVAGPIPEVPGQHQASTRGASGAPAAVVAPASAAAGSAATADDRSRVARVQFVLVAPQAHRVAVVGDFNDWDTTAAPLVAKEGVWSREMDVPYGRHDYAFVVDGERWLRDPNAPLAPADEFGAGYSVLVVGEQSGEHR